MTEKDQSSSIDNQDAVQLIVQRNITKLFKSLLDVTDDLKQQNSSMLLKVSRETSMEFVQQVNYLTPEMMDHIRKRILDLGNESIREISSVLECFELKANKNKLEKLLVGKNNRRTNKSIRISGGWISEK